VLIAVLGATPSVLTETVWALAQESPPVIPHQVVVITTTQGAAALETQLLTPSPKWQGLSVWQSLRQHLLDSPTDPRLTLEAPALITGPDSVHGTTRPLADIRSASDNAAAAEFILTVVRRFSTDPDAQILGLLAGGRKTMGALLHAALSLAGHPGDRLLHVLVNEPFDAPRLQPPFFFPGQPDTTQFQLPAGPPLPAAAAVIELADVPLVALGELVCGHVGHVPASFASLTRAASSTVAGATLRDSPIIVSYQSTTRELCVGGFATVIPPGRAASCIHHLIQDALDEAELVDRTALIERWDRAGHHYARPDETLSSFSQEDLSNALNVIRTKLRESAHTPSPIIERLFPLRAPIGLTRPSVTVQLLN